MAKMNKLDYVAVMLLLAGGLVHGLQAFGLYYLDAIGVFGKIIKGLVGLAFIYSVFKFPWKK